MTVSTSAGHAAPHPTAPSEAAGGGRAAVLERLRERGLSLPVPAAASYSYATVVEWGGVAYVSGQIPKRDGTVAFTGIVGDDRSIEDGIAAAELCALNAVAQLDVAIGLDRVVRILKLGVFVASAPGFTKQPSVAEGASKLLLDAFGDAGGHARTALGVRELPANALVEIELIAGLTAS